MDSAYASFVSTSPLPNIQTFFPPSLKPTVVATLKREFVPRNDSGAEPVSLTTPAPERHIDVADDAAYAELLARVSLVVNDVDPRVILATTSDWTSRGDRDRVVETAQAAALSRAARAAADAMRVVHALVVHTDGSGAAEVARARDDVIRQVTAISGFVDDVRHGLSSTVS